MYAYMFKYKYIHHPLCVCDKAHCCCQSMHLRTFDASFLMRDVVEYMFILQLFFRLKMPALCGKDGSKGS